MSLGEDGRAEASARAAVVRGELKAWEYAFSERNGGKKAAREDIKACPEIDDKYREYQRLRDTASGKYTAKAPAKSPRKRNSTASQHEIPKEAQVMVGTPLKKRRVAPPASTPSRTTTTTVALNDAAQQDTPSKNTPVSKLTFVGPTPHRDGRLLGLFDLLSAETPSHSRQVFLDVNINTVSTPSRKRLLDESQDPLDDPQSIRTGGRGSRTPMSSSKRFMLDKFATPQKITKIDFGAGKEGLLTPSSVGKGFATPAFLRRHTLPAAGLEMETSLPQPWKKRSFGRSLSSMLEEARKAEEHEHDDDLDALRDIEGEGGDGPRSRRKRGSRVDEAGDEEDEEDNVKETQFDMDVPSDIETQDFDDEDEVNKDQAADPHHPPRKPWKKKGLKRQTKRVIMRPVQRTAPAKQLTTLHTAADDEANLDIDEDYSDTESFSGTKTKKKSTTVEEGNAAALMTTKKKKMVDPNAVSHMNFKRLKIKQKNAKPKGAGRGRSGRR